MTSLEVPLSDILIPADRLSAIDEAHAHARAASIKEVGQLQPIKLRKTPPGTKPFKPYTLVFGLHRMRAIEINGGKTVRAEVRDLTAAEAKILEIEENLSRRDLTPLDRAIYIAKRRELHEERHGEIKRGGDQSVKLALWSEELAVVADRVGLSKRTLQRAEQIARNLQPALRSQLATASVPEGQLVRLAKMEPARQREIAKALKSGETLAAAIEATDDVPRKRPNDAQKRLQAVLNAFSAMGAKERRSALQLLIRDYPDEVDWALDNPLPMAEGA